MNRRALGLIALSTLVLAAPRWASDNKQSPGRGRLSIYEVAPGRDLDFLKWLAAREEVAKEAGVPAAELYAHTDGDRWDYLVLWPVTTSEQDRKMDEVAAARGLKTGFPAALEFRELLSSHTDTYVNGPTTAAARLAAATSATACPRRRSRAAAPIPWSSACARCAPGASPGTSPSSKAGGCSTKR